MARIILPTIALMASQLLGVVAVSTSSCHTVYGKTSHSSIPTKTSTVTHYVGPTHTLKSGTFTHTGPIYFTTVTSTDYFTFFSMIGQTTTTLPLPTGFTPLISAKSVTVEPKPTSTSMAQKRARRATSSQLTSPASYPQSVQCTRSTTKTGSTVTTPATTITITPLTNVFTTVIYATTSATTHVATATEFEACQPSAQNILNEFHGHSITGWTIGSSLGLMDYTLPSSCEFTSGAYGGGGCPYTGAAQTSPEACCFAVMMFGINASEPYKNFGFAYYQAPGDDAPTCRSFATWPESEPGFPSTTVWNFTLGSGHPSGLYVGNSIEGQPFYIAST